MSLWTPSEISPHTWIDFSDTSTLFDATTGGSAVTNGVGIARAEDKSGNGRNFTQATSGSRFTYTASVQNGLGVARGDGGDWLTTVSAKSVYNFLHQSAATIFVVNKNGNSSDPVAFYSWLGNNGASSSNVGTYFSYDDRALFTGLTDCFSFLNSAGFGARSYNHLNLASSEVRTEFRNIITPNAYFLSTIRSDPTNATAASRVKIAPNGGTLVGNNEWNATPSGSNSTFDLQIGAAGNNVLPIVGDYCELVIFNSLLSTTDQQLVEGYLAWKWGTEALLPNTHPYYSAAPTVGRYFGTRRYGRGYGTYIG